jgi:hypothetical protein
MLNVFMVPTEERKICLFSNKTLELTLNGKSTRSTSDMINCTVCTNQTKNDL